MKSKPGPKPSITYDQVAALRSALPRLNWNEVAQQLGCSRRTAINALQRGPEKEAA